MNLYIVSQDERDANLVADRLLDQDVSRFSTLDNDNEKHIFHVYRNACEIDRRNGAWKSNKGVFSQRMEKMDTDGLPDYQDNTDDNDAYCSNTAKKARLSSHNSLSNTEPSPSNSLGPCTSQIYTGNFVETNLATESQENIILPLNIFVMPWRTRVSEVLHRLFAVPTAIYILVVNAQSVHQNKYKDCFIQMWDSIWACTRGKDNRFPKVVIAATSFKKGTETEICTDIAALISDWCFGRPYEYQLQDDVFLISQCLSNDQTKLLKETIFKRFTAGVSIPTHSDEVTMKIDALLKKDSKLADQSDFESVGLTNDVVHKQLLNMHLKRCIIYIYRMKPKTVVLDLEFFIETFYKIVQQTDPTNTETTFFRETALKRMIKSNNGNLVIEVMLELGLLAKAVYNDRSDNIFVISNRAEVPHSLQSIRHLPDKRSSPHMHSPILCLEFDDEALVALVFSQIICHLLRSYPYDTQGKRVLLFRDYAAFSISRSNQEKQRLSFFYHRHNLFVYILRYSKSKSDIEPAVCSHIRKELEDALSKGLDAELQNAVINQQDSFSGVSNFPLDTETRIITFNYKVRCPDMTDTVINEEGLIPASDLLSVLEDANRSETTYECCKHSDRPHPHDIDVVQLIKAWFPEKLNADIKVANTDTPQATGIDNRLATKIDSRLAGKIAKCLGRGWQLLAYELGIDQPTVDKVIDNNPKNTEIAITEVITQWTKNCQAEATLQKLRRHIEAVNVSVSWDEFNKLNNCTQI